MSPLNIATDGYLNTTLSKASSGYLSFGGIVEAVSQIIDDGLERIRRDDEDVLTIIMSIIPILNK